MVTQIDSSLSPYMYIQQVQTNLGAYTLCDSFHALKHIKLQDTTKLVHFARHSMAINPPMQEGLKLGYTIINNYGARTKTIDQNILTGIDYF